MSFTIKADTSSLEAFLDKLGDKAEEAVRPAAQAGAQVLYDEVKRRVPVSAHGHWFHGTQYRKTGVKYWFDAGTLRDSIYQVFSKDNSRRGLAEYHVSWNHRKAPYGFMVEYGTAKAPAHSFVRASESKMGEAIGAAEDKLIAILLKNEAQSDG